MRSLVLDQRRAYSSVRTRTRQERGQQTAVGDLIHPTGGPWILPLSLVPARSFPLDCRIYANASVGPLPLPAIEAMNAVIAGQAQHGVAAIKEFHEDLGATRAVAGSCWAYRRPTLPS